MKLSLFFILCFLLLAPISSLGQEKIISKSDADYIFTLNKPQWEEYIKKANHPEGWEVRIYSPTLDTGSVMGAFDPKTGMGLSVQPLFESNYSPPIMIIVESWYPKGMATFTDEMKHVIENEARKDLGTGYRIKLRQRKEAKWDVIQLQITKSEKNK